MFEIVFAGRDRLDVPEVDLKVDGAAGDLPERRLSAADGVVQRKESRRLALVTAERD
jgi:hypothetical protein